MSKFDKGNPDTVRARLECRPCRGTGHKCGKCSGKGYIWVDIPKQEEDDLSKL